MQAEVGRDDTDQRHPGDVVALRDHLRADQHVELAAVEAGQDRALRALACRGVAVEPADARARVGRDHLLEQALGAEALHAALGAGAVRAGLHRVLAVAAVVAAQLALERIAHPARPVARVVDERHVAVFAVQREAAGEAEHPAREAAPVQEQDRLAAGRERLGQRLAQRAREHAAASAARALRPRGRRSPPSAAAGSPPAPAGSAARSRRARSARRCRRRGSPSRAGAGSPPARRAAARPRARGSGSPPRSCRRARAPRRSTIRPRSV